MMKQSWRLFPESLTVFVNYIELPSISVIFPYDVCFFHGREDCGTDTLGRGPCFWVAD